MQWIAAEDTRMTRKLLNHFQIATRMVSYHEHNKESSGKELIRLLMEGQSIALVSDAGLPAISDPGYELVQLAVEHEISVVAIPGANAALSALIVSGLPTDRFTFLGFLPRNKKHLQEELLRICTRQETLIIYESPHRIIKLLTQLLEVLGNRTIALVRELTKRYEEVARGTVEECLLFLKEHSPLGEYCVIVSGALTNTSTDDSTTQVWWVSLSLDAHVGHYEYQGMGRKEAIKKAAVDRGIPKREVYNQVTHQQ